MSSDSDADTAAGIDESGRILTGEDEVVDVVENLLRGRPKSEAITSSEIKSRLHIADGVAQPKTREIITRVLNERDLPVGSSPAHGYWHIQDSEELEAVLDGLEDRRIGIRDRMQAIASAYNRDNDRVDGGGF